MKIAVVGAGSLLGQDIILEAEALGISVISVLDSPTNMVGNGVVLLKKFDSLTAQDLAKCDAVIDLLSFTDPKSYQNSTIPFLYLQKIIKPKARIIASGLNVFLYVDNHRIQRVFDLQKDAFASDPNIIAIYKTFSSIDFSQCVNWNILCPPLILDKTGHGSGYFKIGDDILPVSIEGKSYISLKDYAKGFVELLKLNSIKNCCCSIYDQKKEC